MKRAAVLAATIVLAGPSSAGAARAGSYDGLWDASIKGWLTGTLGGSPFKQAWCCGGHFTVKGTSARSALLNGTVNPQTGIAHLRWEYHSGKTCPITVRLPRRGTWRSTVRCTFRFTTGTFPFQGTVVVRFLTGP